MKRLSFFIFILLASFSLFSTKSVFAAPPGGGYEPGETLDPDCAPGDADCIVTPLIAQDEGVDLSGNVLKLNFTGSGVSSSILNGVVTVSVPGGSSQWTTSGSDIYYNNGIVQVTSDDGTTNPGYMLSGNTNSGVNWSMGLSEDDSSGTLYFSQSGLLADSALVVDSSNNVGIGTTTPSGLLAIGDYTVFNGDGSSTFLDSGVSIFDDGGVAAVDIGKVGAAGLVNVRNDTGSTQITLDGQTGTMSASGLSLGDSNLDSSAILELSSTSLGFLTPRMTEVERDAITTPATGLLVYNTTDSLFNFYNGSSWVAVENSPISVGSSSSTLYTVGGGQGDTGTGGNTFIGIDSGDGVGSAYMSTFLGYQAGNNATNASLATFLGYQAGNNATNAQQAFFGGFNAGNQATSAAFSVFLGLTTGSEATNASDSIFIGRSSGNQATNAANSVFLGYNAGLGSTNAKNSIFIGSQAGENQTVNNTVSGTSILIGNDTSTGGFSNSIALGKSATNTAANQFMIGSTSSPIDVTRINGSASTQCTITTGTGIACTSDERLKDNIQNIQNGVLEKLSGLDAVTYTWIQDEDSDRQIGFLAQQLETIFPELVATDSEGYKSVFYSQMTPILTKAIQELNSIVEGIFENLTTKRIQVEEEICFDDVCLDKQKVLELLQDSNINTESNNPVEEEIVDETISETNPEDEAVEEGNVENTTVEEENPAQEEVSQEEVINPTETIEETEAGLEGETEITESLIQETVSTEETI